MQTLVIQTQYKENYGAHDWDGKGECPQYWKFKGGSTYFVTNLTSEQITKIANGGIPTLSKLIQSISPIIAKSIFWIGRFHPGKNGDGKGPNLRTHGRLQSFTGVAIRLCAPPSHRDQNMFIERAIIGKAEQWIPREEGDPRL